MMIMKKELKRLFTSQGYALSSANKEELISTINKFKSFILNEFKSNDIYQQVIDFIETI